MHFTTLRPMPCDELTMQPLTEDVPSMVSFPNFLFDIASLMPQMHDAIISSNTLYTKYEQVLEYDSKMRSLATEGCPHYFSMREAISPVRSEKSDSSIDPSLTFKAAILSINLPNSNLSPLSSDYRCFLFGLNPSKIISTNLLIWSSSNQTLEF